MSQGTFFKYRAMLTKKKGKNFIAFFIFLTEQLEKKILLRLILLSSGCALLQLFAT